jgi:uncharacterized damage-inducible protein DinB
MPGFLSFLMIKITIGAFLLCGALSFSAFPALPHADTPGGKVVNELVKHWTSSKELSLAVANAMPDADYSFKASPGEMSFGEQMNHIAGANSHYCSAAAGTKGPLAGEKLSDNSKAAAIKNLSAAYDYCIDSIKESSDASLQKSVSSGGNSTTPFELFWGGFTHSAHHRGQAEVYLRLKGITPPEYKF